MFEHSKTLWPDDTHEPSDGDGSLFRMANGRLYFVSRNLMFQRPKLLQSARCELTRYIQEHPEENPVLFTTENIRQIVERPSFQYSDRVRMLMLAIIRELENRPGTLDWDNNNPHVAYRLCRSGLFNDHDDLIHGLTYLQDQQLINLVRYSNAVRVSVSLRGLIAMETDVAAVASDTVFVAMWFGEEMSRAYDLAIAPAIEQAGYRSVRIDKQHHNNKIDDEIIAEIRRSRFVIADFSCGEDGARGGVYYEAGFAAGLGKPVIYMVRDADLPRVHFDTRQFNHIVWTDEVDLRKSLFNRIAATIGERASA